MSAPRLRLVFRLGLILLLCLAAFGCGKPPPEERYRNKEYKFSFIPPAGWRLFEEKSGQCIFKVGAKKSDDVQFYICLSRPPEDVFSTKNTALNCEQLKLYLSRELLAQNVECRTSTTVRRVAYDVMYQRWIKDGSALKCQFVNQVYLLQDGLVFTLTSYALAKDPAAARALFEANLDAMLKAGASFWFHSGSMDEPGLPGWEYRK